MTSLFHLKFKSLEILQNIKLSMYIKNDFILIIYISKNLGFLFINILISYSIINYKHKLIKYCNHQKGTYCYLGSFENTMLE